MDKNIGKKLDGRYEITELIGIGGMADVYKAIDIIEDKTVAVKILKNEFSNDDEFLRRFRNESKAIAVLSHPNIVKIYDVGFTEKIQFIVMEYIDGITLKEFMEQQGVLKWKDAIHFIIQILRALQHAHDRGIVHRDIKPQNIMLFPDGTIKVMDFGIARFAREEGKTLSDKAIGSVHYISPEQARGDFTDEKSDIYSVGVMLYEMVTGQKPFDANNPVSVAVMHMQTRARNPREINDTVPEGLEEIIMRAMQKDASKRYQSASEMIKDIDQFKKNPSIVFEYKYLTPQNEGSTKYFNPISNRNERNEVRQKDYEYEIDEEEEEEEEHSKSYFVPVLMAIAAAVVIIAVFFIAIVFMTNINQPENTTLPMPKLVGTNFNEAQTKYLQDFKLNIIGQEYSDYDKDIIFEQSTPEGREIKQGITIDVKVSKGIRMVDIPPVYGLEASVAQSMLEQEDLVVKIMNKQDDVTKGYVISSNPGEGEKLAPGSEIILWVSTGPEIQDVIVPNVIGKTQDEAVALLTSKKLQVGFNAAQDSPEPAGTVLAQSYEENAIVKPDTQIMLTLSSGKIPERGRRLVVNIPSDASGSYTFTAYINGEVKGTNSYDNVAIINKAEIDIFGSGQQTVIVEIKNNTTNKIAKLAEYDLDFDTGSQPRTYYDPNAFSDTADSDFSNDDDITANDSSNRNGRH